MTDLLAQTSALVNIASVSHDETVLADYVEARLRAIAGLDVTRIGENVIARSLGSHEQRLVLGGHLDTVPPSGNAKARVEGDLLYGCGSADMKGGIAILLDLAPEIASAGVEVTLVFYAREEVARVHSGLLEVEAAAPELLFGDVAILLEPTNAIVEAGCQGVLRLSATLRGRRAHSARPWVGRNAIHRLAPLLARIASFAERAPVIDGCRFHETLQAVRVEGGVAGNVIPDLATVTLSHRFAPDRSPEEAFAEIREWLAPAIDEAEGDQLALLDVAPAAPPSLTHPLLQRTVIASGAEPVAKIGWTDVAFFYERGIPAANFGPGDPLVAHGADEFVSRNDLERVRKALSTLLAGRG